MVRRIDARPVVLLATTTWWPSLAVLASALEEQGCAVVMLCPRGHVAFSAHRFTCQALDVHRPAASLAQAIDEVSPDLVVPGDERIVAEMIGLKSTNPHLRDIVERSLGAPGSHRLLLARAPLLDAAAAVGFTVPETQVLESEADLAAWMARVPPPWVLKADGAWGGEGVRMSSDQRTCRRHFRALRRGVPLALALRRKLVNGDPFLWQAWRARRPTPVSAQSYVIGRPANCAAFAFGGQLLGTTVVEAMTTCGASGPSTLVRAVERLDIVEDVRRLVASSGLSGFFGFDFILDRAGTAALIEMNPRITTPCRFQGPFGPSPVAAAAQALGIRSGAPRSRRRTLFAAFPLAWLIDPLAPDLVRCVADVPWREPGIVRESLRPLWPERRGVAHLPARLRSLRAWCLRRPRTDHRRQPFSWWLAQRCLGMDFAPSFDETPDRALIDRADRERQGVVGAEPDPRRRDGTPDCRVTKAPRDVLEPH